MLDGFYSTYFSGVADIGFGILVLKQGIITGVDAGGALYDGKYNVTDTEILGEVTLKAPPGVHLVTGASSGDVEQSWEIPLKLPLDFALGQTHTVHTPTGKVNVIFRKIRDCP